MGQWVSKVTNSIMRVGKKFFHDLYRTISTTVINVIAWIKENPEEAAVIAAIIIVIIVLLAVMPHILAAAGFTAAGPAAGSAAAAWQAGIGSVAAGSTFAILQSAAMGGYGASIVTGAVAGGGAVTSAAVCVWASFRGRKGDDEADDKGSKKD